MRKDRAIEINLGITGAVHPLSRHSNSTTARGPEDHLVRKEDALNPDDSVDKTRYEKILCVRHDLPKGVSCPIRYQENGLFFCKSEIDCPLR